jgi:hypothetical protein
MKIGTTLAVLGTAAMLTASLGLAQTKTTEPAKASTAPKPAKATTHVMTGTVESIMGTGAATTVVIKGSKSSDKPVTLAFDTATTKTGDLVEGAKVNAHYRVDNGKNIVTSITVEAPKTAGKTAKATAPAPAKK